MTDLKTLTTGIKASFSAYGATGTTTPWDARIALRDLAYQVGGAIKIDMQIHNERHAKGKTIQELRDELEMELAEIVGGVLFVADEMNLNIERGFNTMLQLDKKKVATLQDAA